MAESVKLNPTARFAVLDLAGLKVAHITEDGAVKKSSREQSRLNKSSGPQMSDTGRIGGPFVVTKSPQYIAERVSYFQHLWEREQQRLAAMDPKPRITITLPDGSEKEGDAFVTTPLDVAKQISEGLAQAVIISRVVYSRRYDEGDMVVACDKEEEETQPSSQLHQDDSGELWDLNRPLVGNCSMQLIKFEDPDGKMVFWHSSAHILGAALENTYGAHLTIGPPLQQGFYYDSYMGDHVVTEGDFEALKKSAQEVVKQKHPFQRLVLTKEEALEMFQYNPFKTNLIRNKIPDHGKTTVYRCGPLIDLCMGPHLPNTGKIKAFSIWKTSATNWLGQVQNDPLQRVYGIAFPEKAQMKQWEDFQQKAKERDHRRIGQQQELFFAHPLSPGSAFWLPHGARIYNKLISFIKAEYWKRGYEEVVSPNIFNLELWNISGHALHYKENMFVFDVEGAEWGMKPMNCPAHCLIFGHRLRSYRELPIRMADFGVLHRNEVSGALTGLTRVRRFQQDDAHIFCTEDQIKDEVLGALDFMRHVYGIFGMTYQLELSTKPAKALGDPALWVVAEAQLAQALDEFVGKDNWRVNPGDGAFYGPKIDIKVFDALDRMHQCATVQLDFQLPRRFELEYRTEAGGGDDTYKHPVMVPQIVLNRCPCDVYDAEHFGGKWPFWLSPRQALVVPVSLIYLPYASEVAQYLHAEGFYVDVDDSTKTLNKKVREGQLAQYNYILVVGSEEQEARSVNIRSRNVTQGAEEATMIKSLEQCAQWFKDMTAGFQ